MIRRSHIWSSFREPCKFIKVGGFVCLRLGIVFLIGDCVLVQLNFICRVEVLLRVRDSTAFTSTIIPPPNNPLGLTLRPQISQLSFSDRQRVVNFMQGCGWRSLLYIIQWEFIIERISSTYLGMTWILVEWHLFQLPIAKCRSNYAR